MRTPARHPATSRSGRHQKEDGRDDRRTPASAAAAASSSGEPGAAGRCRPVRSGVPAGWPCCRCGMLPARPRPPAGCPGPLPTRSPPAPPSRCSRPWASSRAGQRSWVRRCRCSRRRCRRRSRRRIGPRCGGSRTRRRPCLPRSPAGWSPLTSPLPTGRAGRSGWWPSTTSRPRRRRSARCTADNGGSTAARSSRWQ